MAAPAGPRVVMGLDPGLRTGVKVAVVDATGKVVDTTTVYPHEPQRKWNESLAILEYLDDLLELYEARLLAINPSFPSRPCSIEISATKSAYACLKDILLSQPSQETTRKRPGKETRPDPVPF